MVLVQVLNHSSPMGQISLQLEQGTLAVETVPLNLPAEHAVQITPSPSKPAAVQAHVNEPTVFVHVLEPAAQLCVLSVHSNKSLQTTPEPEYPRLHMQLNEPTVLLHAAVEAQLCVLMLHSRISAHVTPLPV